MLISESKFDLNSKRIQKYNDEDFNKFPVYQTVLSEILAKFRDRNFHFSILFEEKIIKADMIFIYVNTAQRKGFCRR